MAVLIGNEHTYPSPASPCIPPFIVYLEYIIFTHALETIAFHLYTVYSAIWPDQERLSQRWQVYIVQRWKSQRIKIHSLGCRFSIDLSFFLEITNIDKSLETFGSQIFLSKFLKSIGQYGYPMDFFGFQCFERPSEAFLYHRVMSSAPKKKTIGQALWI